MSAPRSTHTRGTPDRPPTIHETDEPPAWVEILIGAILCAPAIAFCAHAVVYWFMIGWDAFGDVI